MLAVGIAAPLTGLLLAGSDEMSAIVSAAAGHADTGILDRAGLVGLIAAGSRACSSRSSSRCSPSPPR